MDVLITDFDGTLYDNNYEKNVEMIKRLDNIDLIIATGRNYNSLRTKTDLKCKYYILNDGGYILDENENIVYINYISDKNVSIVEKRLKELKYINYFLECVDKSNKINKISVKRNEETSQKDINYLLNNLNNIYGYLSENWINIVTSDSKKSKAIEKITQNYDNIYVIGNEINDIDMVRKYNGFMIGENIDKFIDLEKVLKKKLK